MRKTTFPIFIPSIIRGSLDRMRNNTKLIRWAVGGWTFFIVENAVLSENRTWLIQRYGDDNYHTIYGTLSTIASISIGYAYYKIRRNTTPKYSRRVPFISGIGSWIFLSLGLIMTSQVAPKLQIPVSISSSKTSGATQFEVRCPFDFSDKHNNNNTSYLTGLERITRHPGLWSFGFVGIGQSILSPTIPLKVWWL